MTTSRPYSAAMSFSEALEEVRHGRGTQFAPAAVDVLLALAAEGRILIERDSAPMDQTALSSVSSVR
jgi:HD-GYP domain-containing protein (c-di-GMP phosphodiesterase class II)